LARIAKKGFHLYLLSPWSAAAFNHAAVLAVADVGLPSKRPVKGDLNAILHAID
jgi:hypothetical protein